MSRIYVIHENNAWVESLRNAFDAYDLPYEEWFVEGGRTPIDEPPPAGVFYNRMSASSHTRGHRFAPEQTAVLLAWLERHGRWVINDSRALRLEISKVAQYTALQTQGISTPRTVAVVGREDVVAAGRQFGGAPVIVKPNRGGSGKGVRRFNALPALRDYVAGEGFEESLDGVTLVQEFVESPAGFITRVEFVGGEFLYAVRVDTGGSFELCPADPCAIGRDASPASAPTFTITDHVPDDLLNSYATVLRHNGIGIGAFEYITDGGGRTFTYDLNTNTNYNATAEEAAGVSGMNRIARFLGTQLSLVNARAA